MKKGKKFNNTIRTYKGIKFKSNLEIDCYKMLEISGLDYAYESTKFNLLPGFKSSVITYEKIGKGKKKSFKPQRESVLGINYTPDFMGEHNGYKWIIETKGARTAAFNIRWKLFRKLISKSTDQWILFMPTNKKEIQQSIDIIKNL